MKKRVAQTMFFACFCLLCSMSYGQTGYLYKNGIDGWQNMIRYHNSSGRYITYSWSGAGTANNFATTDIYSSMIDAHVASGYFVQDFEILDDYVFFCGYNASGSGFLGWFDVNDVFFSTGTSGRAHIDETLSLYGIEWLDNIEVYYDRTGRIHIAGVGQHIASGVPSGYKAFEAMGTSPNNMLYRVADLNGGVNMPKLTVTNDFVVYVTKEYNVCGTGIGVTLEPFPKDNMFPMPTHPTYFFQSVVTGLGILPIAYDPYLDIGITCKEKNTIAVCNYRCGFSSQPDPMAGCTYSIDNNFLLVLREFDLDPLLVNNPIQMITDSRVTLPLVVSQIRKLAYDPLTKHYITLFRNEVSPGMDEDGIMTMDYSSGAAPSWAQTTYQQAYPNGLLCDICLDGSSRYTASGFDWSSYHNYFFWQDAILSNAYNCANYINYSVMKNGVEVHKEYHCLSNVVGWIALNFIPNMDSEIHQEINSLICN